METHDKEKALLRTKGSQELVSRRESLVQLLDDIHYDIDGLSWVCNPIVQFNPPDYP
jgi:hypothetical protein